MRAIIAEDDMVSRRVLEATLTRWGYEVVVTEDGNEAWEAIQKPGAPRLLILDWMMPGLDGPEICQRVRTMDGGDAFYILLLTAKARTEDIVAGLDSGADDYITKPFEREELQARVKTGQRIVDLNDRLAQRVTELEGALAKVQTLEGLLPICSYCKRIREGEDYRQSVETYVSQHSAAIFSHSICPDCYEQIVKPQLDQL